MQILQAHLCLKTLQGYVNDLLSEQVIIDPSIIIAGSLNASQGSCVYDLIVRGQVPPSRSEETRPNNPNVKRPVDSYEHTLELDSAYVVVEGAEPVATLVHGNYIDATDFIFFQPSRIAAVGVLHLPAIEHGKAGGGMPNTAFGSAHFPIAAKFIFKE